MKQYLLFLCLMFYVHLAIGQPDKTSFLLRESLENNETAFVKLGIDFNENLDLDSLRLNFDIHNIPVTVRPKILIQHLQQLAGKSQKGLLSFLLQQDTRKVKSVASFWIVNRIIVEMSPDLIPQLSKFESIKSIDLETVKLLPLEPYIQDRNRDIRSPGGVEPGLIAINAPKMWALGYSGRGRLVYNYDTGVWPDHPSFDKRFLGLRFPLNQAWLGYSNDYPNGLINNHGTHTLGTMIGVDESVGDTIGVALSAYWMANDYVGTTVGGLPPVEDLIYAYEWALDPDGNPDTYRDIPDVINNSWRFSDDPTKAFCESFVVDLLNVMEAAGIANVFSGGNAGPNNTTVSAPQRINTSIVNTFSVGSVDANQNYPFPISDFSTRGPTQCDGVGSLKIHPQVVAPGQNVRSAWGNNEYNSISGTSMAAPHVSGAVLLLKEAFPFLSGEELMLALYETAIDFGEDGEDNTYGNGLIDVYQAYLYLKETYEPVNPNKVAWDLELKRISGIENGQIICEETVSPELLCVNLGDSTIREILVKYWFTDTEDTLHLVWAGEIEKNDSVKISVGDILAVEYGQHELNFSIKSSTNASGALDYDVFNNRYKINFIRRNSIELPIFEDFENGISSALWLLKNPDHKTGWDTFPTSGLPGSNYSATMQFYDYKPRDGQKDFMILPNLIIPEDEEVVLSFDLAYQPFFDAEGIRDTLRIYAMESCRQNTSSILYEKAGETLIVSDTIFINFKPKYSWQWRKDSVLLNQFRGEKISIVFEATNLRWNNLYIDNIAIDKMVETGVDINANASDYVSLYPNPARNSLNFEFGKAIGNLEIRIYNAVGELIKKADNDEKNNMNIDISEFQSGLYICHFYNGKNTFSASFIKI